MGVASHLGIRLRDYDAMIRTFIPDYVEMLDEAASALRLVERARPVILDLGIGSGALAARTLKASPRGRVIGLDVDPDMLALAGRRLGARVQTVAGSFLSTPLPACDAITASFALHHIRTRRQKAGFYRRCRAALRPGGVMAIADCCPASDARLRARDRRAWRAHLERTYSRGRAERYLRTWAREDVYVPLEDEIELLDRAGLASDVAWRRGSFAVILARRRRKGLREYF
jgi:SAM-dependent methyltransferase